MSKMCGKIGQTKSHPCQINRIPTMHESETETIGEQQIKNKRKTNEDLYQNGVLKEGRDIRAVV